MRILTGSLKGRILKSPKGSVRPTQDKVRKAIFDILGASLPGSSFLELFAGTGAVGIEALSCAAGSVCFVENDRNSLKLLKENLSGLKLANFEVLGLDSFEAVKRFASQGRKFDIIFLDPPYYKDLAKKILQTFDSYDILFPSGLIIIQHFKKDVIPEKTNSFNIFKQKMYGDTVVSFYQMKT